MWMGGGRGGGASTHGSDETGTVRPGLDGGREARVSRYREKRRTRLFSKKIRYEVRKLNAEKRPRMKGRFVKRASSHV
jgi:CCT motif